MKRIILIFMTLFMCAVFLRAQNYDAIAELQRMAEQLSQDYFSEKISLEEFQKQFNELSSQMSPVIRYMEQSSPSFSDAQARRIEELMDQSKYLEMQFNNKLIGEDYFAVRSGIIKQEQDLIIRPFENSITAQRQLSEISQAISSRWPGTIAGWPPAWGKDSVGELCGLGPFFQSEGTRASYSYGKHSVFEPVSIFSIYQTGADEKVFMDLKNQIERAAGKPPVYRGNDSYSAEVINPAMKRIFLEIYMYRDVVCFTVSNYSR